MAAVTETAVAAAKQGDPLRVIPIRNTATSGVAEDVDVKEGLRHIVKHVTLAATADTYTYGRPVRSAAFVCEGAITGNVSWDPDDATGVCTIAISGGGAGTGWLHIWSRD
jgi:hypothetical protein